jgi:hypothetical protein
MKKTFDFLRIVLIIRFSCMKKDNEPLFIDTPGLYEWDSPDFRFAEFKNAEEEFIKLGSKKIILVQTGTVGVTYQDGTLKILKHGRHIIESATHVFHRFLSTQQKSIRLSTQSAREKAMMKASKATTKKDMIMSLPVSMGIWIGSFQILVTLPFVRQKIW